MTICKQDIFHGQLCSLKKTFYNLRRLYKNKIRRLNDFDFEPILKQRWLAFKTLKCQIT